MVMSNSQGMEVEEGNEGFGREMMDGGGRRGNEGLEDGGMRVRMGGDGMGYVKEAGKEEEKGIGLESGEGEGEGPPGNSKMTTTTTTTRVNDPPPSLDDILATHLTTYRMACNRTASSTTGCESTQSTGKESGFGINDPSRYTSTSNSSEIDESEKEKEKKGERRDEKDKDMIWGMPDWRDWVGGEEVVGGVKVISIDEVCNPPSI